jgi:hypothetical protein
MMHGNAKGKLVALVTALLGATALQGCALTTGVYVPDRSPVVSHSMLGRFDQRFDMRYAEPTGGLATGKALHVPHRQPTGVLFFHY